MRHGICQRYCFLIALAILFACQSPGSTSQIKDAPSTKTLARANCEKGQTAWLTLSPPSDTNIKKSSFTSLPGDWSRWEMEAISKANKYFRLELCIEGDHYQLVRSVDTDLQGESIVVNVDKSAKVEGIKELIEDQNYSKLSILIPYDPATTFGRSKIAKDRGMLILGAAHGEAAFQAYFLGTPGNWKLDTTRKGFFGEFNL